MSKLASFNNQWKTVGRLPKLLALFVVGSLAFSYFGFAANAATLQPSVQSMHTHIATPSTNRASGWSVSGQSLNSRINSEGAILTSVRYSTVLTERLLQPSPDLKTTLASNSSTKVGPATATGAIPGANIGMTVADWGLSASQQATEMANLHNIGLQWVRIDASWNTIQAAGPSSFDWSGLDQAVKSIIAVGMKPELIIDYTPEWARRPGATGTQFGEPASASAYAAFAGEVAARYTTMGVSAYEIWNEPNIPNFWYPAPNPSLYTAMLRDSYAAIKAVAPNAKVITGGLAPTSNNGVNIAPINFLQDMYADGAQGSFDAVGYHAYSSQALPNTYESWSGWSQMNQTSPSIRSVMTSNGDSAKQIWITEVGAPSAGPRGVGTTAQAEEVTQAVRNAQNTPWIGKLFLYTYQDSAGTGYFGLLNADGSPKLAWSALAAALK